MKTHLLCVPLCNGGCMEEFSLHVRDLWGKNNASAADQVRALLNTRYSMVFLVPITHLRCLRLPSVTLLTNLLSCFICDHN
eukprot:m.8720 g.8720  ORF g.8720 m.8720 type:complete len:81 (-) comp6187_c0_seq1:676-918(-)